MCVCVCVRACLVSLLLLVFSVARWFGCDINNNQKTDIYARNQAVAHPAVAIRRWQRNVGYMVPVSCSKQTAKMWCGRFDGGVRTGKGTTPHMVHPSKKASNQGKVTVS